MSHQERRTLLEIVTSILIIVIYGAVMYQRYHSGEVDTDVFQFWSRFFLLLVVVSIVARIIIAIIFSIINSIVSEIKGEKEENVEEAQ